MFMLSGCGETVWYTIKTDTFTGSFKLNRIQNVFREGDKCYITERPNARRPYLTGKKACKNLRKAWMNHVNK